MKYVYLLQSINDSDKYYTGLTDDVEKRLSDHNTGKSPHTAKFRPWRLIVYLAFTDEEKALAFEKYLKSGSGRAFSKRHFR